MVYLEAETGRRTCNIRASESGVDTEYYALELDRYTVNPGQRLFSAGVFPSTRPADGKMGRHDDEGLQE